MATLSEYFEAEARDALAQIAAALDADHADTAALHRAVRSLRGTAQMAREEHVFRAAAAFEAVTKALVNGELQWSDALRDTARSSVGELSALVSREGSAETQQARAGMLVDGWRAAGAPLPDAVDRTSRATPQPATSGTDDFVRFAAQEVAGIADTLDRGVQQLASAPMDRDPLKAILRRQRTLLGAARLDELPVVAEILRAVEDLTRVVAKLDVGVKQDWLDVYRIARDGLRSALEPLERGENPPSTNAVSRLRTMRQELLDRFGTGEAVSAAHSEGLVQAQPIDAAPRPAGRDAAAANVDGGVMQLNDEQILEAPAAAPGVPPTASDALHGAGTVVPVEALCYTPQDALRQALALHDVIMRATADDPEAHAAAEELFDLIRYAVG